MNDLIRKALSLGIGITAASKEKLESYVGELVKKGEIAPEQSKQLVASLIQRGEEEQGELKRFIREQLQKLLGDMHMATKQDIERLEHRIEKLEQPHHNG